MNKFQKLIAFTKELAGQPSLINLILNRNDFWKKQFLETYGHSESLPQISLMQLSSEPSITLPFVAFKGGGSMPTDLAILQLMCKKFEDCNYFEIGTWRGESAVNVADETAKCFTLNLSPDEMRHIGLSEDYIKRQGEYSKENNRITHLYGNSLSFDFSSLNQKFDVIFIDGNHEYQFVLADTKNIFKDLTHPDSVVIWHDYAFHPESIRFEVYKAILDAVPKENHTRLFHVANSMCAVYLSEKILSEIPDDIQEHLFQVQITLLQD